jgi:hypothetical protein
MLVFGSSDCDLTQVRVNTRSENRTMDTTYLERIGSRPQQNDRARVCPKCGATMVEADRVAEGDYLYIWYECSGAACDEQWLSKRLVEIF